MRFVVGKAKQLDSVLAQYGIGPATMCAHVRSVDGPNQDKLKVLVFNTNADELAASLATLLSIGVAEVEAEWTRLRNNEGEQQ